MNVSQSDRGCTACGTAYRPASNVQKYCKGCVPHKKARTIIRNYGLPWPQYVRAIANPCPLCGDPATVIDHDHKTGRVRAPLCHACNLCLSRFENPAWRERALAYVSSHSPGLGIALPSLAAKQEKARMARKQSAFVGVAV